LEAEIGISAIANFAAFGDAQDGRVGRPV